MTEWSGQPGRLSNSESPQQSDEQSEYYPNDEHDTDSPPVDPAIPTVDGASVDGASEGDQ